MKKLLFIFTIILMSFITPVLSNDLNKGYKAYKKGDYSMAFFWYQRSAAQGNPSAQYNLGNMYRLGKGVAQDFNQAFYWCKKSAEQGKAIAQYNLGLMYFNGDGVFKDYSQSVYWYKKSAEQGDIYAQNNLGYMYEKGYGVPKDKVNSYMWYHLASYNGYRQAGKSRDALANFMYSEQIDDAQAMALRCFNSGYQNCG